MLGYIPGDTHGMNAFYNDIVPKNLGNILKKLDRNAASPEYVNALATPSNPAAGKGFNLFSLSPEVRRSILDDGLPLFSDTGKPSLMGSALAAYYQNPEWPFID